MTDAYQSAAGWNNAAGLATLPLQPGSPGILHGGWQYAVGGAASWLFDYTELTHKGSITPAEFNAQNTALGVSASTPSAQRTMRLLKDDRTTWANYNVIINYPDLSGPGGHFELAFYHDLKYTVMVLGAAS